MDSTTPVSPVSATKPELVASAPAVNGEPVELDGHPTSLEDIQRRRSSKGDVSTPLSPQEQERRAKLHADRQGDPAIVVDVPATPNAEEYMSKDAEISTATDEKSA